MLVGEIGAYGVDDRTPEIDGDDEVLCLDCGVVEAVLDDNRKECAETCLILAVFKCGIERACRREW